MRRRKLPELTDNHERWLISYADFITLLFAFFVVMYSTSAVNRNSFGALSDSIVRALGLPGIALEVAKPGDTGSAAIPLGLPNREADEARRVPLLAAANDALAEAADAGQPLQGAGEVQPDAGVDQALQSSLGDLIAPDRLALSVDSQWLEIRLPASVLFPSGSRALLSDALPLLDRLGEALAELPNEVIVQGHTDNEPIRNGLFPSNWELSTARAAAVVRVLEEAGIDGSRLSAQGYGSTRPISDNDSDEGRSENRRVMLLVRNLAVAPEGLNDG